MSSIPFSFSIESKLRSLSEKIKCFSQKDSTGNQISQIFFEKEKYCVPLLTAHIIKNLTFPDMRKSTFLSVILDYNVKNKKELKFEEFEKLHWIRIIQDEVILPEAVKHTIWLMKNNDTKNKIDISSENKRDMILCLATYYKPNDEPSITKETIKQIITSLNLTMDSISFLLDKHILEFNKDNNKYIWRGHLHHQPQLENEVSAILWLLIKKDFSDPEKAFWNFLYLARKTGLYFRKPNTLLSNEDLQLLCEQAVNYIQHDHDLLVCDDELEKIRLDGHPHHPIDIIQKAPDFNFRCNTVSEFLEKINLFANRKTYDFTHQGIRSYVYIILRLIVQYEQTKFDKKIIINDILSDLKRPSIFFIMKHILINDYPHMIPFLISDIELIPLSFQMLDDIEFNNDIFISSEGANNKLIKEHKFRNEIWLEFFEITVNHFIENFQFYVNENIQKNGQLLGEALCDVFIYTANKIFEEYWINNPSKDFISTKMHERYTAVFQIFKKAKTKFNICKNGLYVKSKLSYFLLPYTIEKMQLSLSNSKTKYNHFFHFDITNIDVLIDMLELASIPYDSIEIEDKQKQNLNNLLSESTKCICNYLEYFFSAEKMDVLDYDLSIETKDVDIAFDVNKLNRTNWTLLVMLMEKYGLFQHLICAFDSSIKLNKSERLFDKFYMNQYHRIRVMLRILLYSYLKFIKEETKIDFTIEQRKRMVGNLEESIVKYAKLYSKNDIQNDRIDAFYVFHLPSEFEINDNIFNLLLMALNHFPVELQKYFVESFFSEATDLKRMLAAINSIESEEVKKIVVDHIVKINIDEYIDSCHTVTEWEETLIEAINSEKHWYFAESLIKNIKEHYKRRNDNSEQVNFFFYQVEMSLALRNKDLGKIENMQYQRKTYGTHNDYNPDNVKSYFIALYFIENDTDYDKAIDLLNSLLSNDEKNIRYSLLLYRARFLKIIKSSENDLVNRVEINVAWQEWQNFKERLGKDEEKITELHQEGILLYSLPYFIINKDNINFDHAIASISDSDELLYSPKLVKLIYDYYIERELDNYAFRYLNKAKEYFKITEKTVPAIINGLLLDPGNNVLTRLRNAFSDIINLHYRQIPFVTPSTLNGKKELRIFILYEIIKSLKKLKERKKAIGIEDNYTDLVQSILSMRFPFYGWNISEQQHRGVSPGGKLAGEVDLAITAESEDIALVEALILKGRSFKETKDHILKSFSYSNMSDQYYIVVYYQGKEEKFDYNWAGYKENILKIDFPKDRALEEPKLPFIDLSAEFDNVQKFRIAKTCHKGNFEMYHIMVDFSQPKDSYIKKSKSPKKLSSKIKSKKHS